MPKRKEKGHHEHLNRLGILSDDPCVFNTTKKDDSKRLSKQRKKYGFDDRETWSLDYTMAGWIYSHLKMYKKIASRVVDLRFHKFNIPVLHPVDKPERNGGAYYREVLEEHDEAESIDICLKYLKVYLMDRDGVWEEEDKAIEKVKCAMKILAEIYPALWW